MEARKITVVQTKGQGKTIFMSGAERLGELKSDLRENKISYDDMIFYEGVSRTELVDDQSVLPKDIPFKGQTTNELVIYLTLKNKKIRSGAMTRSEAYAAVKDNNLGDAVKAKFNKNFTQVSTSELETFVTEQLAGTAKAAPKVEAKVEAPKKEKEAPKSASRPDAPVVAPKVEGMKEGKTGTCEPGSCCGCGCKQAITLLVGILEEEGAIYEEQKQEILDTLGTTVEVEATAPVADSKPAASKSKLTSSFSDRELDELAPRY